MLIIIVNYNTLLFCLYITIHSLKGELHDAKLHLLHAIKLQPTNRMAYLSLASVYEKLGDLQNAEEAKKKANVKSDNKYL